VEITGASDFELEARLLNAFHPLMAGLQQMKNHIPVLTS